MKFIVKKKEASATTANVKKVLKTMRPTNFKQIKISKENYEMTLKLLSETLKSDVKRFYNASTCEIFGYQKKKLKEILIYHKIC